MKLSPAQQFEGLGFSWREGIAGVFISVVGQARSGAIGLVPFALSGMVWLR